MSYLSRVGYFGGSAPTGRRRRRRLAPIGRLLGCASATLALIVATIWPLTCALALHSSEQQQQQSAATVQQSESSSEPMQTSNSYLHSSSGGKQASEQPTTDVRQLRVARSRSAASVSATQTDSEDLSSSSSSSLPLELVFTNQTGAIIQCQLARELVRQIARTERSQASQASSTQPLIDVQIRWERADTGESIESTVYAVQASSNQLQDNWNGIESSADSLPLSGASGSIQQQTSAANKRPLRYVRLTDGALAFEPFRAIDYRVDVHSNAYRCVASSPSRGATIVSNDMRVEAIIQTGSHSSASSQATQSPSPTTSPNNSIGPTQTATSQQSNAPGASTGNINAPTAATTSALIDVLDELVIAGNSAQFKCQIGSMSSASLSSSSSSLAWRQLLHVYDWIESPTELTFSAQSTTLLAHTRAHLFAPARTISETTLNNASKHSYFVDPKSGDLHIVNVDTSLSYRSYRCRCRNRLTGELISSQSRGKLLVTEARSPVAPRLAITQMSSAESSLGELVSASVGGANFWPLSDGSAQRTVQLQATGAHEANQLALVACPLQAHPRAHYVWYRKSARAGSDPRSVEPLDLLRTTSVQVGASGSAPPPPQRQLQRKYAQVGNLLLIQQLQSNDSATYQCLAQNALGEQRFDVPLQVRRPLEARLSASATVLELGKSLALECTVEGFPIHSVVFRHNRRVIKSIVGPPNELQSATNSVTRMTPANSKRLFQSRARYKHMQATGAQTAGTSGEDNYFVLDDNGVANSGAELAAAASSSSSPFSANAVGGDESELATRLSHVIVIVLEPEHAGAYQCQASNQYESVQSSVYIKVLDDPPKFRETFRPQIIEQQREISLQCAARANPLPEITWSVDGEQIPESSRVRFGDFVTKDNLVISYVNISQSQVRDSGLYKCVADNGLAQVAHEAQVSVSGPIQVKPMRNVTVLAGATLRIKCPVAGWPLGEIQWLRSGKRLPTNHKQRVFENGTLVVEHMERGASDAATTTKPHQSTNELASAASPAAAAASNEQLADEGEYTCVASSSPATGSGPQPARGASGSSASGGGSSGSGSVWVSIRAKPIIEPFTISRSLREGQRATLMCTISSGDLPIEITWFHNGKPLAISEHPANANQQQQRPTINSHQDHPSTTTSGGTSLVGVRVSRVSDYSSTLLFETLLADHSGNYTCLARNLAGEVSHSAPMIVQVAPKWTVEPADTSVVRSSGATIDCAASGFPPPRVIWTKSVASAAQLSLLHTSPSSPLPADASLDEMQQAARTSGAQSLQPEATASNSQIGNWRSIVSSPHLQVSENGSLNILDARDSDAGHYMCQASNGVGAGLSKVIRVTINVAAQIVGRHSNQYVRRNEQTQLKCLAKGDWPLSIYWLKNKRRLEPTNLHDSNNGQGQSQDQSSSNNNNLLPPQMRATGSSSTSSSSSIAADLLVSSTTSSTLVLAPLKSSSSQAAPAIQLGQPTGNGIDNAADDNALLLQRYSLTSNEYIAARDYNLLQQASNELNAAGFRGFVVGPSAPGGSHSVRSAPLVVQVSSALSISQADRSDTATFRCVAMNQFGVDERTVQLVVQEPPDRVEELAVKEVGSRSIKLAWLSPYDGNAPITHYHVHYRTVGSQTGPGTGSTGIASLSSSSSSASRQQQPQESAAADALWFNYTLNAGDAHEFNPEEKSPAAYLTSAGSMGQLQPRPSIKLAIGSLRPMSQYWFRVSAENKLGRGPVSAIVEASTSEEAPGAAPTKLRAVAQSSSSILVSWSKISEKELYGPVHGYHVGYRPLPLDQATSGETAPPPEQTSGSQNKTSSPDIAAASTTSAASSSPAALAAATSLALTTFKTIQHDPRLAKFDALLTGLKRSTRYAISVQAFNGRGTGPATEPVLVRTLEMDPPRQVKLFVKQASNCSIQLEWRPLSRAALASSSSLSQSSPTQSGDFASLPTALPMTLLDSSSSSSAATQTRSAASSLSLATAEQAADIVDYYSLFQAELNEQPQWQEIRLPGSARGHTIESLKCGKRYQFYMMGVNRIGVGDQSDILDTKTAGGLPLAPDRQTTFDVINATCYILRLDHWQENGCPMRSFNVRYRAESSRDWIQLAQVDLADLASAQSRVNSNSNESTFGDQKGRQSRRRRSMPIMDEQQQPEIADSGADVDSSGASSNGATDYADNDNASSAYFDYSAADAAASSLPALIDSDFNVDYLSDASSSSSSSSSAAANLMSNVVAGEQSQQAIVALNLTQKSAAGSQNDNQLFSLLKDSMLPAFDARRLLGSHTERLASSSGGGGGAAMARQQWDKSSSLPEQLADIRSAADEQTQSQLLRPMRQLKLAATNQMELARRVRLCNLAENTYYIVQVTSTNSVGDSENEWRILTSPEALEYDHELKRHVIGPVGGAGQLSLSDRMTQSSAAIAIGNVDRFGGLFALNQWPVLVPITLTLTLMTIIMIIALLLKQRQNSPPSSASTTTTTTTTTLCNGANGSSGGGNGSAPSSGGLANGHYSIGARSTLGMLHHGTCYSGGSAASNNNSSGASSSSNGDTHLLNGSNTLDASAHYHYHSTHQMRSNTLHSTTRPLHHQRHNLAHQLIGSPSEAGDLIVAPNGPANNGRGDSICHMNGLDLASHIQAADAAAAAAAAFHQANDKSIYTLDEPAYGATAYSMQVAAGSGANQAINGGASSSGVGSNETNRSSGSPATSALASLNSSAGNHSSSIATSSATSATNNNNNPRAIYQKPSNHGAACNVYLCNNSNNPNDGNNSNTDPMARGADIYYGLENIHSSPINTYGQSVQLKGFSNQSPDLVDRSPATSSHNNDDSPLHQQQRNYLYNFSNPIAISTPLAQIHNQISELDETEPSKLVAGGNNNCFINIVEQVARANDPLQQQLLSQQYQQHSTGALLIGSNQQSAQTANQSQAAALQALLANKSATLSHHHHFHQQQAADRCSQGALNCYTHDQRAQQSEQTENIGPSGDSNNYSNNTDVTMRTYALADENGNIVSRQQAGNGNSNENPNEEPNLNSKIMFDPVYATIRRTFPQAFKYLTLQHNNQQQLQQQIQNDLNNQSTLQQQQTTRVTSSLQQQQQQQYKQSPPAEGND